MTVESVLLRDLAMLDLGSGVPPQEMALPDRGHGKWVPVHPGSHWGGYDQSAWFHATANVPPSWSGQLEGGLEGGERTLMLRLLLGTGTEFGWPEGLLYVNGRLQQGINRHHPDVLLPAEVARAASLTLAVRAWSGMLPDDHRIAMAEIVLLDRPTERLYHLLSAGADLADALDERDPLLYALAGALDGAYDTVELSPMGFYDSARAALSQLEDALRELTQRFQPSARPVVTGIGHGHLDVAWLWQTRHTREKAARTFSIAIALMDAYPEYVFLHTTPQVFAWLKADYPDLYQRVKARVAEGRFEAAGAMWVESDCNLVSGESLVRQILYGQQLLREEFGREYNALWLPDAFGYSSALPQIMLRSGIPVFMTTKLSWSETNRIPADTFHWRGTDGSTVLAHFITTPTLGMPALFANMDTYNGALNVASVLGVWARYRQKALNSETLLAFGHGDGGAGPTRQHLEQARAIQQLPGMPVLRLGRADEYFERLRETVAEAPGLPTWDGDLYLEYHRGTYTTQSWLKRIHRQLEGKLLLAEWLDASQWVWHPDHAPDRREALDAAWRTLLMHEFHDILPGSSIATVYWDARVALSALDKQLDALTDEALAGLLGDTPREGVMVVNPAPCARQDVLALPERASDAIPCVDGRPLASQRVSGENGPTLLVELPEIAERGMTMIQWAAATNEVSQIADGYPERAATNVAADQDAAGIWLKNAFLTARLNDAGEITSLVDHRVAGDRELVPSDGRMNRGRMNRLVAYEDLPREFDAWDLDAYYARKPYALETTSVRLVERGPLRAAVEVARRFRASTVIQRIVMYRANPRIDFETRIDWHEQHVLLKADFAVDLRAPHATCEIQYGAIERQLHRNTTWDQARFEIPAHRWLDLSEGDYGISLLNDGRYGHDMTDGRLGLTLLRSPTFPDPQADQGEHSLIYSLYPHPGDWRTGGTVETGYALNRPLLIHALEPHDVQARPIGKAAAESPSARIVTADAGGVVIEAIKRSQDGQCLIVRAYEAHGERTRATIRSALPLVEVKECDLLERRLTPEESPAYEFWQASAAASHDEPDVDDTSWRCEFRPFEVRTFRVTLTRR